jgi:hypothetical protein
MTSSPPKPASRAGTAPWSPAEDLAFEAIRLLESSGYAALRLLRCEIFGGMVIVRGLVPSF